MSHPYSSTPLSLLASTLVPSLRPPKLPDLASSPIAWRRGACSSSLLFITVWPASKCLSQGASRRHLIAVLRLPRPQVQCHKRALSLWRPSTACLLLPRLSSFRRDRASTMREVEPRIRLEPFWVNRFEFKRGRDAHKAFGKWLLSACSSCTIL